MRGVDILKMGSGNPGATNVWRTCGPVFGISVFLLDVAKGLIPAVAGLFLTHSQEQAFYCGALAIIGHSLSPFLRFKGGKGISTGLGALLGSSPLVALSAFGVFLVCLAITRWVSLSSIVAALALMVLGFVFREPMTLKFAFIALGTFIIVRHIPNIKRLLDGSEPKFTFKKKPPEDNDVPGSEDDGGGAQQ
jgi:glycerol-3-phosphate acyltransferase PlsY